ncbi:hypothetical protein N7510_011604 [Penicillium lagena]|uniref:uncharacterized protein n=1 Tax=Penicillium lagena TaxID=94218 RepID=UPI00253F88C4|nr:uncharacterized protein N7510_011604 [Penicillium lagena]KAJ5602070.1 hypothetical protein N7510_011604 [Penicillium lagena]
MSAVRNKIAEIRREENLGTASSEMKVKDVDRWIGDMGRDLDLQSLLRPTLRDQEIINQVGNEEGDSKLFY